MPSHFQQVSTLIQWFKQRMRSPYRCSSPRAHHGAMHAPALDVPTPKPHNFHRSPMCALTSRQACSRPREPAHWLEGGLQNCIGQAKYIWFYAAASGHFIPGRGMTLEFLRSMHSHYRS